MEPKARYGLRSSKTGFPNWGSRAYTEDCFLFTLYLLKPSGFAVITLVYVLTVLEGVTRGYNKMVKLKKHPGGKYYPNQSLFRFELYFIK